ncbi:MAG: hypothetical protein KME22_13500 [Hassallia sp. WJT32-NPBG1]|jgi:hypothetical protein|nr:hypothetical protein [Hassallia sp. WJT32-NPBG1]
MSKVKTSDCWYTPPEIVALIQSCLNSWMVIDKTDSTEHLFWQDAIIQWGEE